MKKVLILCMLIFSASIYSIDIPKKMLKGISVENDEFTGVKTYTTKGSILRIIEAGDSITLKLYLECYAYDSPIGLERILILSKGETTFIERNNYFSSREIPTRRMKKASSGNFGTSSYVDAEFETRMMYIDVLEAPAFLYKEMIESIIQNTGKIKFEGSNRDVVDEFNIYYAKKTSLILNLYNYMTTGL